MEKELSKSKNRGDKLMKILVSGPLLSMSGYGKHARQVLEFVLDEYKNEDIYCDVKQWGNTNWNLCSELLPEGIFNKVIESFISENDINKLKEDKQVFDTTYQICFPSEWDTSLSNNNIGVFAGIESTMCCKKWIDKISAMSKVIVPSQHALNSINNACDNYDVKKINTPIIVIPEWFYVELNESTNSNTHFLNKVKTDNNLLIISQLNKLDPALDRKNIINTLDSCIQTLSESRENNFGIVLKLFCENNSLMDFYKTKKIVSSYINIIKSKYKNIPKIYVVHGNLTSNELSLLYKSEKIKCIVSGTRGEGFGLTLLEAAACGLPIIATNWSAYDEFLDYYLGIDFELVNVPEELNLRNSPVDEYSNIWVSEAKWAEFDKKSLSKALLKVINNEHNRDKIAIQQKTILNKYSKNAIMSIYKKQLGR